MRLKEMSSVLRAREGEVIRRSKHLFFWNNIERAQGATVGVDTDTTGRTSACANTTCVQQSVFMLS